MKQELKNDLHQIIEAIEDEETLNILKEDLAGYAITKNIDGLSTGQLKELDESIEEVDKEEQPLEWKDFKIELENRWRE